MPQVPQMIGYGAHCVDEDDVQAVVDVLRSDRLTQGQAVPCFEEALELATGAPHAVAVSNGTAALQLAYLSLDVGRRSRVITTANTFLASATAAIHCGARVGFCDIDGATGNLDPDALEEVCESVGVPQVVTVVHYAGLACDMQRILELKRRYGFALVEDAAHALGATYTEGGRSWRVGEHPEVDVTVLSFHPVKLITTGEGGAVLCHSEQVARRLRRLRDHGREASRGSSTNVPMIELGINGRLSDIHCALGTSQLAKLPAFEAKRRGIAARYLDELSGYEFLHADGLESGHAWHLFVIRSPDRDALVAHLKGRGVQGQVHYHPVPHQPWFRERSSGGSWPNAERHGREALSLPIHASMSDADQGRVIDALHAWDRGRLAA